MKVKEEMKIKYLLGILGISAIALASCDNTASGENTMSTTISNTSTQEVTSQTTNENTNNNQNDNKRNKPTDLSNTSTLYIVGDSTVDEFLNADGSVKDSTYFYERCGWGGHIKDFTENITIKNFGASGRSSKDYVTTDYYNTIKSQLKEGDYLMIGFGHNDEKSDDAARFTDASKPITDNTSFKYSLYENYIKLAESKNATPILCTPIVRLSPTNDYTGSTAHITSTGDYRKAIVELGEEKSVKVIDLTTYTKNLYSSIGYDEAVYYHAITAGKSQTEPNVSTVDKTHINNFGSKSFDYFIATELYNDSNCYLGNYIKDEIEEPTKEKDLKINTKYTYVKYSAPTLPCSTASQFSTITSGWYGTAFGDTGGDPASAVNGYIAKETSAGVFQVGQSKDAATYYKGKIGDKAEGLSFCFRQISVNDDFTLSVDAKVLKVNGDGTQDGFGIMLRDACFAPKQDSSLMSNYVAAGIYRTSNATNVNFSRSNLTSITKSGNTLTSYPSVNDTVKFTLTRTGQKVVVTTTYGGTTYTTEYLDFDFVAMDSKYFYLGMFGARGTVVEFTNVSYEKTGSSQGA